MREHDLMAYVGMMIEAAPGAPLWPEKFLDHLFGYIAPRIAAAVEPTTRAGTQHNDTAVWPNQSVEIGHQRFSIGPVEAVPHRTELKFRETELCERTVVTTAPSYAHSTDRCFDAQSFSQHLDVRIDGVNRHPALDERDRNLARAASQVEHWRRRSEAETLHKIGEEFFRITETIASVVGRSAFEEIRDRVGPLVQ